MLNLIKRLFAKLKAQNSSDTNKLENQPHVLKVEDTSQITLTDHHQDTGQDSVPDLVPDKWVAFDENLLERARTQWQFGDWESLTNISRENLQHHPERAKLALLVAAGHAQCGNTEKLQQFIHLAKDWGCSRHLISQVLISGVQNSLGCAAIAAGQSERAQLFFEQAVKTGMPAADTRLLLDARARQQRKILGVN